MAREPARYAGPPSEWLAPLCMLPLPGGLRCLPDDACLLLEGGSGRWLSRAKGLVARAGSHATPRVGIPEAVAALGLAELVPGSAAPPTLRPLLSLPFTTQVPPAGSSCCLFLSCCRLRRRTIQLPAAAATATAAAVAPTVMPATAPADRLEEPAPAEEASLFAYSTELDVKTAWERLAPTGWRK